MRFQIIHHLVAAVFLRPQHIQPSAALRQKRRQRRCVGIPKQQHRRAILQAVIFNAVIFLNRIQVQVTGRQLVKAPLGFQLQ